MYFIDDCNISSFLLPSKCESPYKSNVILLLSVVDSKLLQMDFRLFIRSMRYKVKWWQWNRGRLKSFKPSGSKMLKMLFCTGWAKYNNLLLKIEIVFEFLILRSRLNQSFRVQGKSEYLKQSVLQSQVCFLCWRFALFFIILNIQQRRLNHLQDFSGSIPNSWNIFSRE